MADDRDRQGGEHAVSAPPAPTRELLASVLAMTSEHITIAAPDGTITYLNRTIAGLTLDEVIGTSVYDWLDAGSQDAARAAIEHVLRTGEPSAYEARALIPGGQEQHYHTLVGPLMHDGAVVAVNLLSTNQAELKRAVAALDASEQRLRLAVHATDMGIWHWDATTDIVTWDDAMCRHFHLSREEAPTTYEDYQRLIYPADRDAVVASIGRALESGVYADVEHRTITGAGEIRWLQIKGAALHDDAGNVVGLHGGVFDITERRRLEEQLRQGQKLQAVGQLASGVAHNFNNMLAGVLTNLALAARRGPPSLQEIIADATTSASRAAEVVRQLVELTRRVPTTERQPGDLAEIVHRVTQMCRKTFDRAIEVRLTCPPDLPPVAMSASQIEQALLNLAINARDAVLAAGVEAPRQCIEVDLLPASDAELDVIPQKTAKQYIRIRVSDNGPGVDDDVRARIFEPFFTTKTGTGAGLGLATALATAIDHGGWLGCDPTAGLGATFTMYLPCTTEPITEDGAATYDHRGSGRGTVLLVDDEDLVRRSIAALLEDGGYTVLQASDGKAALERYATDGADIDVVLLDQSMPGMSGEQVLERLVATDPGARVVLFTGHTPTPERFQKAAALLQKPIAAARLFEALQRYARTRD